MYQSPDFVKVELMVKTAFANTSGCPYDEGTDYVSKTFSSVCPDVPKVTYVQLLPNRPYQCYSSLDM